MNIPGSQAIDKELRYRLLKLLHNDPNLSQRKLAQALGVSLGKANYCIQALLARGLLKARNFKANRDRKAYAYFLTPKGLEEKTLVTLEFFRQKLQEHEEILKEIEELRIEVQHLRKPGENSAL